MTFVFSSSVVYDPYSSYSTFLPYCNAPVAVDGLYQSRHFQEVYYAPEPAPQVQVIRQRLPDPPPDVIERVLVVPQPKQYIYQVVEVPTKPPPVIQQRVVHQSPNAPLCGGTYQVQVPSKGSSQSSRLVQSSSSAQISPSPTYVQASPSYISTSPNYVQVSPSYVQSAPTMMTSPPMINF